MATAAEIRKRVRAAERERVKGREAAAVAVAAAHKRLDDARSALADAEADFRSSVTTATGKHEFSAKSLSTATGVNPAEFRNAKLREPDPSPVPHDPGSESRYASP